MYLKVISANLVLKLKATGGLFIRSAHVSLFENNAFFTSFCEIGRLNYLLEKVPVKFVLNTKTGLLEMHFTWRKINTIGK